MKKAVVLTCLLAFLCLLSGCGKADAPTITPVPNPPKLVVTVPEGSVTKNSTYYHWHFLTADGESGSAACTPAMPAEWSERQAQLETAGQTASLFFDLPPDEIGVTCRNAADGTDGSCSLDETGALVLSKGRWVYYIMAQWTDESREYHGFAQYTICIEMQ